MGRFTSVTPAISTRRADTSGGQCRSVNRQWRRRMKRYQRRVKARLRDRSQSNTNT